MKEEIIRNLDNPSQLEKMYREYRTSFKREFNSIYPEIENNTTARIWNERLNYEVDDISWGTKNEIFVVLLLAGIAAFFAKIPMIFGISEDYFFPRNVSFIVLPLITAFFTWKQQLSIKQIVPVVLVLLGSLIYINFLPDNPKSDTLILACIHIPLFLWAVLGFTFSGYDVSNLTKRIEFLRYNGDLVVMTGIMIISGGILTGITIGLFNLINIKIEKFFGDYIIVCGLAAAPIIGTFLVRTNQQLVNKVSPVIAKIFSPLVLVMLVIYVSAIIISGKDPYNDRDFLLIFNILLIGVMALILFSISETTKNSKNKFGIIVLLLLSIVTIVVNGIALSAIVFRIAEWGFTPNRTAVLGSNMLILINLLLVAARLFKASRNSYETMKIENTIAAYLPIYAIWTIIVTFVFPIIFNFK